MPPSSSRSICSWCTSRQQWHRTFSTTRSRHSVGPESPRFITVPEAVQTPKPPQKPVKGVLPIPRNLFKPGQEIKASPEYLSKTAPEPKDLKEPEGPESDRIAWKLRMAESRRANLKEGVRELLQRKEMHDRVMDFRGSAKKERHERLSTKPERRDERLTTPTLHNSVRRILAREVPSSSRRTRLENKYPEVQARKSAERKDMLHTLYTHARSFIVTEEAMNEALDKSFGTDENPIFWNRDGNSIWATGQKPAGIKEMMNPDKYMAANIGKTIDASVETVVQKRMRRIAEEFTGGRMR